MLKKVTLLLVSDPVSTYRESGVKPASTVNPVSLMFEVNLCIYKGELIELALPFSLRRHRLE